MEEFRVPVYYGAASDGQRPDPNQPPNHIPDPGLLAALGEMNPSIIEYLTSQSFAFRAHTELVYYDDFAQWQFTLFFSFAKPGEGIIFAMWFAEQDFEAEFHANRSLFRRRK